MSQPNFNLLCTLVKVHIPTEISHLPILSHADTSKTINHYYGKSA